MQNLTVEKFNQEEEVYYEIEYAQWYPIHLQSCTSTIKILIRLESLSVYA